MNQLTKKRKKKGFTLIELIAVIAIIGILAAVLVPKVIGYMNDAKKSKIVAQARTVVMAYETVKAKEPASGLATTSSWSDVKTAVDVPKYADHVDVSKVDMIGTNVTVDQCIEATDGKKEVKLPTTAGDPWDGTFEGGTTTP